MEKELLKTQLTNTIFAYLMLLIGSTRYLIREGKVNPYFDTTAYVSNKKIALVLVWYRDDSLEYARQLMDMTCVDHMDRTRRFNIWYTGLSTTHQKRFNLLTSVPERIPAFSAMFVYKSLDGAEREAWDMFGVPFAGHSDLRRILTDYGFKGFPLRKNYPTVGYFEKRGDDIQNAVVQQLVTLMQESRAVNPFYDYRVKGLPEIELIFSSERRAALATSLNSKKKPRNYFLKGVLIIVVGTSLVAASVGWFTPPILWEALAYNCSSMATLDNNVYSELLSHLQPQYLEDLTQTYLEATQTGSLPYSKTELLTHLKFVQEQQKVVMQAGHFFSTHPFLHFFSHRIAELDELIRTTQALQEIKAFLTQYLKSQTTIEGYVEHRVKAEQHIQELLVQTEEERKFIEAFHEKVRSETGGRKMNKYVYVIIKGLHLGYLNYRMLKRFF